ncbi:uncharacterized protein LOC106139447 isoform X1 [Amyelois transitella]|uniref:uncharacterized protein LOC106139447 isoform X1 n=2 Tax=Amyelois transitella TaxID=680683 RepID=UPI00067B1483|nr:uncharacterized protein LOC106139447 isoform X1 [Amyelois transitella]
MEKPEQPKKCFCARCFLPICPEDKVNIDGQSFHRLCSTCCICRTIPTSLKMFYGHVFCTECFNTHVLTRFRGENPRIHSNSWWMQWAPGAKPQPQAKEAGSEKKEEMKGPQKAEEVPEEAPKRCTCARCLQAVEESSRVLIDNQSFHPQCAKCYFCHKVPATKVKIYYGQVFCEDCFNRYVLSHNKDNPTEFFRTCFEQWQNNAHFADNMREFMSGGNKDSTPFVFMMQPQQFCRCGATPPAHDNVSAEHKKSATPATVSIEEGSNVCRDLSFENRTEVSDIPESCAAMEDSHDSLGVAAAEKIEKLTKYLHERRVTNKSTKKWKNFEYDQISATSDQSFYAWIDFQNPKTAGVRSDCPKCLWQCGPIYVNGDIFQKEVCCEEN